MRKAFKFYRSYFEVYNELSDLDKLKFIDAILRKQFYGEEPSLKGMAQFAYKSQQHSIDSQVKGYEDKTGLKLTPTQGGYIAPYIAPSLQEKEKEKEKEQYVNATFNKFWDYYGKKVDRRKCLAKWKKLKESEIEAIRKHLPKYIEATPDTQYRKNPLTYLNGQAWLDEDLPANDKPKQNGVPYSLLNLNV